MAKTFKSLVGKMSPESRDRVAKRKREMLEGLALQELREARRLTQQQLAESLHITQASVSKMESQSAMGGQLRIVAAFPDGEVLIDQFEDIDDEEEQPVAS